jgi:hypothetical protein
MPTVPPYPDAIDFAPEIVNDLAIIQLFNPSDAASMIRAWSWRHAPSVRDRTIFSKIPRYCPDNSIVAACFLAIMTSLAEKMPQKHDAF